MLRALALIPDSPLLLPGAAGRADPGLSAREAALSVVAQSIAKLGPDGRVVAIGTGEPFDSGWRDPFDFVVSLAGLGVPDDALPDEIVAGGPDQDEAQLVPVNLAVACALLEAAGWRGPVRYVLVPPGQAWTLRLDFALALTSDAPVAGLCTGGAPETGQGPWEFAAAFSRLHSDWLPTFTLAELSAKKAAAEAKSWGSATRWQGRVGEQWSVAAAWSDV